jgi:hypothetical protein
MDLKENVMNRVRAHYNEVYDKYGNRTIGVFLIGSQNYELDIETSDVDTIAIIMPSISDITFLKSPTSITTITNCAEHIVIKDVRLMMKELLKGSPNILEIFFTDYYVLNQYWWEFSKLIGNRERIAKINPNGTLNAWVGIARKYIKKYKEDIDNFTMKDAIIILRASEFLKNYFSKGLTYKYSIVPTYAGALRAARRNNSSVELLYYNIDLAIPIIENADIGHLEPNLTGFGIVIHTIDEIVRKGLERQILGNEGQCLFL